MNHIIQRLLRQAKKQKAVTPKPKKRVAKKAVVKAEAKKATVKKEAKIKK